MSVIYQSNKNEWSGESKGPSAETWQPPPDTVKKSTMYIIIALCFAVTSMAFASTATVVYFMGKANGNSVDTPQQNAPGSTPVTQAPSEVATYFTRWGRTECPSQAEVLYTGYTVGSRYNYHGGSSNVLCLPHDPQFKAVYGGGSGTYLYGSEYNARNTNLQTIFGKGLNEQDVPCAVCEAKGISTIMIPARTDCYGEWTKQYSGYLMTSHEAHNKSMDIVCIDEDPEVVPGQGANNNGALFYFVEANGQLPSPPYVRGYELTCVVCTK